MNKKILITGALGHIGSKLIHNIKAREFEEIIMLDNISTQRYSSLFNLPKDLNYKFIEGDILQTDLNKLIKNVHAVVHLAAITDAPSSFKNPKKVEQVNFEGTKLIAEACIQNDVKLLFPSTTSVYGSQSSLVDEDCLIDELKPQSPYAEFKLKSEQMLNDMSNQDGLKYIVCRFGTIFGTSVGMRFHTAVNKFCWQSVMGEPLTVWKTAMNQKRPYLGVKDAVRSIKFIIENDLFNCTVFNVLSCNSTVRQIIEIIKLKISKLNIELVETEIMNQLSYEVSCDKFKNTGFKFADDLQSGIFNTIDLFNVK